MCVCVYKYVYRYIFTCILHTHTHARSPARARFLSLHTFSDTEAGIGYGWIGAMRRAHPTAGAHCRALDSPAASLRSWNCSTHDTARRRPAAPARSCSCRRAHSSLHGAFDPARRRLSVIMLAHANGAPLDFEDNGMATSRNTSLASSARTAPMRAWQFANWVSQLLTSDATRRGIWAWQTTPNATSATRTVARLLRRTRDISRERQMQ